MCTCGCAQLLGECNHVGCPESGRERQELSANIAAGMTDPQILDWFAAKYGITMLAAPPAKGFDLVAWIAPFAVFLAALGGTIWLIRRWGGFKSGWMGGKIEPGAVAAANNLTGLDAAERGRREQIRRDIEGDN
jgi:cytochrome c-type biogenesis protein CcmH